MKELRARASSLVKTGQWEPAAEALAELLGSFPDDVALLAAFSNVLVKLQRWPEAAVAAARLGALSPGDAAAATRALKLLLRAGDLEGAAEAAERCRDLWDKDATLALLSARAFAENGQALQALELLRGAIRLAPDLPDVWHEAARAAEAANDQPGAFELALQGARRHPGDLRLQKQALRLALAVEVKPPDLLDMARSAVRLAPDDPSILRLAGRTCGQAGSWREAVAHLQQAADLEPGNLVALTALFNASERAKDFKRAADTADRITPMKADDALWWRKLAEINWRAGREAASRAAFAHSVALRAPTLPDDLAAGLRALRHAPGSYRVPRPRLDWAYAVQCAAHPEAPLDRETWDRAAQWSYDAHCLIADWLEVRTERHEEIARQADLRGLELLERPVHEGKGAFLAMAHLGPVFAIPMALYSRGLPFRWLADVPNFPGGPLYDRLVSVKFSPGRSALADVHAALCGGEIVVASMDGDARRPPRTAFLGQTIWLNETAARMAHWTGAAPLFLDARWVGERIRFQILPMVAPEAGESADAYLVRWTRDYLDKLTDIVTSAPENLLLSGGLWACVRDHAIEPLSPTLAAERE